MRTLALVLVLCAASTAAGAETFVSGFQPRFGTAPSNPDQPNYRPPDRPPNRYDFSFGVELFGDERPDEDDGGWGDRDRWPDRDRRGKSRHRH